MNKQKMDEQKRIQQLANQGVRDFFSLVFQGKFRDAIQTLQFSKEVVRNELMKAKETT